MSKRIPPRVLLLCTTTGYQTESFVTAARKLGAEPVFGTDRCHVLDDPWRDGALALRFHQPEAAARIIADYAAGNPVDAIVSIGDAPTITAALACRDLGIPFHPPSAAIACRNKFRSRQALQAAGMLVPYFTCMPVDGGADPPAGIPFPCVLKPGSMSASRGVMRADDPGQFRAAFERIAALIQSPEVQVKKEEITGQILVEGFIPGREFAVEGIMDKGTLQALAIFDKPDPLDGPYFEETIYVTPSRHEAAQGAVGHSVAEAARALGLYHGPIHAELRLNREGPWILEVAARPIGGLCARALRFGDGLSLEELILSHALGRDVSALRRESAASGVMMIPIPLGGIFSGVTGLEQAMATPGTTDIKITAKPGQKMVPWPEGSSYLGFIFARAAQPEEVEAALRAAHQCLDFTISADLPIL